MKTEIQETELYKQFKKALNIQHDMRPDDNPFVVACCEIAENYAKQKLNIHSIMQGLADFIKERKIKHQELIKAHRANNNPDSVRKTQTRLSELVIIETAIDDLQLASPTVGHEREKPQD